MSSTILQAPGISQGEVELAAEADETKHPFLVALGERVTKALLGPDRWVDLPHPNMGGEDFAYYIRDYPGALFFLGMGQDCPSLHSARFDFRDSALASGITFLVGAAIEALATVSD